MNISRRQLGFTLIEMVVALTIVAMIGGVSVLVLRTTSTARQRVDSQSGIQQEARSAISAIAVALANANRPRHSDDIVLEGTSDRTGDAPSDHIRFATVSHQAIRRGEPESDVHEVEFFLAAPDSHHMPALMRRTDPVRNDPPRRGGVLERLADNVASLSFEYFDGIRWSDDWLESRHEWPVVVRVSLAVIDPEDPSKLIQASRLISFPRRAQAPAGPEDTDAQRRLQDADQERQQDQQNQSGAAGSSNQGGPR